MIDQAETESLETSIIKNVLKLLKRRNESLSRSRALEVRHVPPTLEQAVRRRSSP